MFKISIFNKLPKQGLDIFDSKKYILSEKNLENANGIVLRSWNLLDSIFPENLEAIARAGAGFNNIPVDRCTENGIVVFNTPGANANGVMELTLLSLLLSSRKVIEGINFTKPLAKDIENQVEKYKSQFAGPEIAGKTLGVIGLGAIGVLVANMGIKLGMNVVGHDPYMSVKRAVGLSWDIEYSKSLENLLSKSDYITIHIPLVKTTTNFINAEKIEKMKNGTRLINLSRGCLVNDDDVINALNTGKLSKYITDFPNDKLIKNDNIICMPHLGASTPESEINCAKMAINQLTDYLENGNIKNSVNYPSCSLERTAGTERISLFNKNIPNMINSITYIFAKYNINIIEMVNKSKNEYAYNIIDIKGFLSKETLEELRSIEGVIRVRHIH